MVIFLSLLKLKKVVESRKKFNKGGILFFSLFKQPMLFWIVCPLTLLKVFLLISSMLRSLSSFWPLLVSQKEPWTICQPESSSVAPFPSRCHLSYRLMKFALRSFLVYTWSISAYSILWGQGLYIKMSGSDSRDNKITCLCTATDKGW